MRWLDNIERKYGKFAINNLIIKIIMFMAMIYALDYINPNLGIYEALSFNYYKVMDGEVWRVITFLFLPERTRPLWIIFVLYVYYLIGNALEHEWGTFRFNVYYFLGAIGTILSAILTRSYVTATYIHLSLFLAFAYLYPNYQFYLFFFIPVKVKYLALLNWIFFGYTILTGALPEKLAVIASIINFMLFFGKDIFQGTILRRKAYDRRKDFKRDIRSYKKEYFHKCTVCGVTEIDNPDIEFRYCAKCDGAYEYCMDHLYDHEHK